MKLTRYLLATLTLLAAARASQALSPRGAAQGAARLASGQAAKPTVADVHFTGFAISPFAVNPGWPARRSPSDDQEFTRKMPSVPGNFGSTWGVCWFHGRVGSLKNGRASRWCPPGLPLCRAPGRLS